MIASLLRSLILVPVFLLGCSSLPTQPELPAIPPSLATPCPPLRPPGDGTGGVVLKWGIQIIEQYAECQSRHRRLVEAWPK